MRASRPYWSLWPVSAAAFVSCMLISAPAAHAEVTLDGTLGPGGPLAGPDYAITDDLGQLRGANLFHSFGDFTINTGESATFTGPTSVENILGRVTGASASFIDGRLSSQIPGANLYLMNPSGLMFGPNATLDISGSFHATTADYISLADGGRFDASNPTSSVLTTAPPAAFGFLSSSPAAISLAQSQLEVPNGESLSLVGGETEIAGGTVTAESGKINIASVSSAGEVIPADSGLQMSDFENQGNIHLFGGSSVSTSGPSSGQIVIRGGRLEVDNASVESNATIVGNGGGVDIQVPEGDVIITADGSIRTDTFGTASGLELEVDAKNIILSDGGFMAARARGDHRGGDMNLSARESMSIFGVGPSGFASGILTGSLDAGDGGRLNISTPELTLSDDGDIFSFSNRSGRGSDVLVNVDNRLEITGGGSIGANTFGAGTGGNLVVSAGSAISISGNAGPGRISGLFAQAQGSGDAGTLSVTTPDLSLSEGGTVNSDTSTGGGKGADISVSVGDLTIDGGSDAVLGGTSIRSTTSGSGQGGNISIAAFHRITLDGQSGPLGASIASDSLATGTGTGPAGHITLTAPGLKLLRHATISGSTRGDGAAGSINLNVGELEIAGGLVDSSTIGAGQAGHITIAATDSLTLVGIPEGATRFDRIGQVSSLTTSSGDAGTITISSPTLVVDSGGRVSTQVSAGASGAGGNIRIEGVQVRLINGGFISAASFGSGDGGGITITASDTIQVVGKDSTDAILVLAGGEEEGAGDGGRVSLETERLVITDGAIINSSTRGFGQGGNISLWVSDLDVNNNAAIAAVSTGTGLAGNVTVHAKDAIRLENGIVITGAIQSDGGNIMFNVGDTVYLLDSEITASVSGGAGNGGNISIDPEFVILNRSDITANAFGGDGGNILIVTDNFLASSESNITASSRFGLAGEVVIRSPQDTVIVGVEALPESFLDVSSLLTERCAARTAAKVGSFVVLGRGGVPPAPDSLQPSSYVDVSEGGQRHDSRNEADVQQSDLSLRSGSQSGGWLVPSMLIPECGRPGT